jgi:hypothetical protein
VQPHLHGPLGDAEPAGDRRLGEVLVVAQPQQLPVALVEAVERGANVGPLDRVDDAIVVGSLLEIDDGDRVGANAGVLAEGLVADDRRQPLLATGVVAQGRAAAPGAKQGVLRYVLGLTRVARVAIGQTQADAMRFLPLPAITRIMILDY